MTSKRRRGFGVAVGAVVWVCGMFVATGAWAGSVRQPGIDVSHFQDTINWSQVAGAGEQFAFVKATEGLNTNDAQFTTNMPNAKAAGILAGAYHFAHPELTGHTPAVEAAHFLGVAEPYISAGYLPPVLDFEEGGGTTITTDTSLSAWVNDFCADVKAATGVDPIVYTPYFYAQDYLDSSVTVHKLWVEDFTQSGANPDNGTPGPTNSIDGVWGPGKWNFFQYSDSGTVNGIDDAVDLDSFNGSQSQLQALVIVPEPAALGGMLVVVGWGLGRGKTGRKRPG